MPMALKKSRSTPPMLCWLVGREEGRRKYGRGVTVYDAMVCDSNDVMVIPTVVRNIDHGGGSDETVETGVNISIASGNHTYIYIYMYTYIYIYICTHMHIHDTPILVDCWHSGFELGLGLGKGNAEAREREIGKGRAGHRIWEGAREERRDGKTGRAVPRVKKKCAQTLRLKIYTYIHSDG
jgi:hypothetical protein